MNKFLAVVLFTLTPLTGCAQFQEIDRGVGDFVRAVERAIVQVLTCTICDEPQNAVVVARVEAPAPTRPTAGVPVIDKPPPVPQARDEMPKAVIARRLAEAPPVVTASIARRPTPETTPPAEAQAITAPGTAVEMTPVPAVFDPSFECSANGTVLRGNYLCAIAEAVLVGKQVVRPEVEDGAVGAALGEICETIFKGKMDTLMLQDKRPAYFQPNSWSKCVVDVATVPDYTRTVPWTREAPAGVSNGPSAGFGPRPRVSNGR